MWFDVNNIIDVKVISITSPFQVKNTEFLDIKKFSLWTLMLRCMQKHQILECNHFCFAKL